MALTIVHYNDPVLRKKGVKVTRFDDDLRKLAHAMVETMHKAEGIGLAAQQVGLPLMLCVIDLRASSLSYNWKLDGARPPPELFMPLILVNPEVQAAPVPTDTWEEGCLSFPDIRGDVERPERIVVRYQDPAGGAHELECDGLLARCVQHEVDHLYGVLFIDRMSPSTLAGLETRLKKLKRETRNSLKSQRKKAHA